MRMWIWRRGRCRVDGMGQPAWSFGMANAFGDSNDCFRIGWRVASSGPDRHGPVLGCSSEGSVYHPRETTCCCKNGAEVSG